MIILSMLAASIAAPAPAAGELRTFDDWIVGCDNGRACQAVALMPEDWPEDALTMSVRRGAEPSAAAQIEIALQSEAKASALSADGKKLHARLAAGEMVSVHVADVGNVIGALRSAGRLEILGADGASLGTVSLKGASAALLYMDDQQRRVGTVTALVRRGSAPASAVPARPALPRVIAGPASTKAARRIMKSEANALRRQACDDIEVEQKFSGPETFRLDARYTLALVPLRCWSGAYNFGSMVLIGGDRGPWLAAPFDSAEEQVGEDREVLHNVSWDPQTRRLESYSKGRGLGDCGVTQAWVWTGKAFRMVEQTEMGKCRGSMDYITTYRADVIRR